MRFAILLAALTLAPQVASACSCAGFDIEQSYRFAPYAFTGVVTREYMDGRLRVYKIRVRQPGNTPYTRGQVIEMASRGSSAACGGGLRVDPQELVLFADLPGPAGRHAFGSCSGERPVSQLSADDLAWLRTRWLPSTQTCMDGSPPVSCPTDPCATAVCNRTNAVCEVNECTCEAEFYDRWLERQRCAP